MDGPVDAVYTWVNGSDPEFIKSLEKFQTNNFHQDMDNHRFEGFFFKFYCSNDDGIVTKRECNNYVRVLVE